MRVLLKVGFVSTALVALFIFTGCGTGHTGWQSDVVKDNMSFTKLRYTLNEQDTTSIIGLLKNDTEIMGIPCKAGWIHFTSQWKPKDFCLSRAHTFRNVDLPAEAWIAIHPDNDRFSVVYPTDTLIKGYNIKGGGGMNGVQTTYYSSGALRQFFPASEAVINDIKCQGGIFHPVTLHENGRLMSCTLNGEITAEDRTISSGTDIKIDTAGIITAKE